MAKGKLLALFAVFAAIGLVTATGAFTTVSAERTTTVNVAGDSSALLQLQPAPGPNGLSGESQSAQAGYARINNGQLEINIAGWNNQGAGVNLNAETDIERVFTVTNQGTQSVEVSLTDSGSYDTVVSFYNATNESEVTNLQGRSIETDEAGSTKTLDVGESMNVSIYIDTTDSQASGLSGGETLVDGITIEADGDT